MPDPRTLYRKIVDSHTVKRVDDRTVLLYVDAHFANEYTSPQAFAGLREREIQVFCPESHLCVVDHIIPSAPVSPRVIVDENSARQASNLARNCADFGIDAFYGPDDHNQGIEHVLIDEQGIARPGMTVICGDSHTTTHGALAALAFGIGTSEIEHILATQTLVYRLASTMRVTIDGVLPAGSSAKDLALFVLRSISASGALGAVVEYRGEAVAGLSVSGRMTLCNLTVEAGARGALIAPDEKTVEWVRDHAFMSEMEFAAARRYWDGLHSDPGAVFDREISLDASGVEPMVTWGTSPDQCVGISETIPTPEEFTSDPLLRATAARAQEYQRVTPGSKMEGLPIDRVFIGSCTNSRLEDLMEAAELLRGRRIAPGVRAQIVPGSMRVRRHAESLGLDQVFLAAGCEWRKSGCSLCLAMNDDVLAPGERCASTTNRNFEGRQGRDSHTHLVSPRMAAAAALRGCITDWRRLGDQG